MKEDYITLKWGTLKAWKISSALRRYHELGVSPGGVILQHDTAEQKELICQIIDECAAPTIGLDWDGAEVSKDEAKRYVLEYGLDKEGIEQDSPVRNS